MCRVPSPDTSNHVTVAYTGHKVCSKGTHPESAFRGLSDETKRVALVTDRNSQYEYIATGTLIHEVGHLYGAKDHPTSTESNNEDPCIYRGSLYSTNGYVICDECKSDIENNVDRYDN